MFFFSFGTVIDNVLNEMEDGRLLRHYTRTTDRVKTGVVRSAQSTIIGAIDREISCVMIGHIGRWI
jgi:hypothetical protein